MTTILSTPPSKMKSYYFELSYAVTVPEFPRSAGEIYIWLPFPRATPHQSIHSIDVDSNLDYRVNYDAVYGNAILFARAEGQSHESGFHLNITTRATRYERRTNLALNINQAALPSLAHYQAQLSENKHIKFTPEIQALARKLTADKSKDTLQIARSAYEYVIENMEYDKSGDGWGQGDTLYACQVGKGNCTDFHSLFLGILRACGIPGQFEIGVAFPANYHEGDITFFKCGYHCWTSFYVHGLGLIPADCSEAAQKPELHDYYFGNLDENRFLMSYGRDICLVPESVGGAQNFFTDPVVETESGTPVFYEKKLTFRTLDPAAAS